MAAFRAAGPPRLATSRSSRRWIQRRWARTHRGPKTLPALLRPEAVRPVFALEGPAGPRLWPVGSPEPGWTAEGGPADMRRFGSAEPPVTQNPAVVPSAN